MEQDEYRLKVKRNEEKIKKASKDSPSPSFKSVTIRGKDKLYGYSLNPAHPTGKNKARVFKSALGMEQKDYRRLAAQIRSKAAKYEAVPGEVDKYGRRYTIDMPIKGPNGKTAVVRTAWIVRSGQTKPDLVSAYVK
ncbi:MAG: hypothetical protein Q4E12_07205 [Coriobacteriia bacterium]|nr:hypothetical protein [Coriobacteriia bacterium]